MQWWLLGFALALGVLIGWALAYSVIAAECEKLGTFYVGSRTFRCVEVEDVFLPEPAATDEPPAEKPGR